MDGSEFTNSWKPTHTPGPWKAAKGSVNAAVVTAWGDIEEVEGDGFSICTVWADRDDLSACADANASLIAAAPDLLVALLSILEIGKRDLSNPKYDGYFESARAAIAKAEGAQ